MIQLAIVPILGLLCICGLCVYSITRQSGLLAAEHRDVADVTARARQRERDVNQAFCDAVMDGQDVAECYAVHERERSEAFPGELRDPSRWSEDDLEIFQKDEKKRRAEAVNRRLLLPAIGGSLVIVACTVVASGTLYFFESSRLADTTEIQVEIPEAELPLKSDADRFAWPEFDETPQVPNATRVDANPGNPLKASSK